MSQIKNYQFEILNQCVWVKIFFSSTIKILIH